MYLIELGARLGGNGLGRLVARTLGVNLVEAAIRLAVGDRRPLRAGCRRPGRRAGMVYALHAPHRGVLAAIRGVEAARRIPEVHSVELHATVGSAVLPYDQAANKLGYLTLAGESPAQLRSALTRALAILRFDTPGSRTMRQPAGAAMSEPTRRPARFLVLAALTLVAAAWALLALPQEREIGSVWVLLAKLIPFVLATEAVAAFDPAWARRLPLAKLAIPAAFLVYFCFFTPKIFFNVGDDTFDEVYNLMLTLTPFLILALVLAYRLAGGGAGTVRRLSYAMLLLMLSGLEDLAYILVNPHTDPEWQQIPEVWTWAHHMTVFVGQPLTRNQAFAFIAVHVVLALLVLFLPAAAISRPLGLAWPAAVAAGGRRPPRRRGMRLAGRDLTWPAATTAAGPGPGAPAVGRSHRAGPAAVAAGGAGGMAGRHQPLQRRPARGLGLGRVRRLRVGDRQDHGVDLADLLRVEKAALKLLPRARAARPVLVAGFLVLGCLVGLPFLIWAAAAALWGRPGVDALSSRSCRSRSCSGSTSSWSAWRGRSTGHGPTSVSSSPWPRRCCCSPAWPCSWGCRRWGWCSASWRSWSPSTWRCCGPSRSSPASPSWPGGGGLLPGLARTMTLIGAYDLAVAASPSLVFVVIGAHQAGSVTAGRLWLVTLVVGAGLQWVRLPAAGVPAAGLDGSRSRWRAGRPGPGPPAGPVRRRRGGRWLVVVGVAALLGGGLGTVLRDWPLPLVAALVLLPRLPALDPGRRRDLAARERRPGVAAPGRGRSGRRAGRGRPAQRAPDSLAGRIRGDPRHRQASKPSRWRRCSSGSAKADHRHIGPRPGSRSAA